MNEEQMPQRESVPKSRMPEPIFGNLQHLHEDTGGVKCMDSHGKFLTVADASFMALDYADLLVRNHGGDIDAFDKLHEYRKLFSEWMPKPADSKEVTK